MYYSKSTNGFYELAIHGAKMPADAVQITEAQHADLLAGQSANSEIIADADGMPMLRVKSAGELLENAMATQIVVLGQSYASAVSQPVNYTSRGGVTKAYQADEASIANLSKMLLAFAGGAVPAEFAWLSQDNTPVPFAYADLQGLAAAIGTQAYAAFVHLQQRKAAVRAAGTVAAVQGVVW